MVLYYRHNRRYHSPPDHDGDKEVNGKIRPSYRDGLWRLIFETRRSFPGNDLLNPRLFQLDSCPIYSSHGVQGEMEKQLENMAKRGRRRCGVVVDQQPIKAMKLKSGRN